MAQSLLAGLNLEETQQELLTQMTYLLLGIFEKMPRLDGNDRLIVNPSESTAPVAISSGTVTTVSTVSNITNVGGKDAANIAYATANIGCAHIYNNIIVS